MPSLVLANGSGRAHVRPRTPPYSSNSTGSGTFFPPASSKISEYLPPSGQVGLKNKADTRITLVSHHCLLFLPAQPAHSRSPVWAGAVHTLGHFPHCPATPPTSGGCYCCCGRRRCQANRRTKLLMMQSPVHTYLVDIIHTSLRCPILAVSSTTSASFEQPPREALSPS